MTNFRFQSRFLFTEIVATLPAALLVYAAMSKLLAYSTFARQLHTHPLLKPYAGFLAWAVPVVELAITALLVIPATRLAGLYGAAGLLAVFTVYLAMMLLFYKNLPCSCGGVISSFSWGGHIMFNSVFIGLSIMGIILDKRKDKRMIVPGY